MKDIPKEYLLLFNAITDIEDALQLLRNQLVTVQQHAEDLFLEGTDPEITLVNSGEK